MQNNNIKLKTDLKARAYVYALSIMKYIDLLGKQDMSCEVISKQLLRSATSVGANIIEAQAGRTKRDFTNYFTHALKSANESKFWLGLLRDSHKADQAITNNLLQETTEIANMLGSSVLTLKGKNKF